MSSAASRWRPPTRRTTPSAPPGMRWTPSWCLTTCSSRGSESSTCAPPRPPTSPLRRGCYRAPSVLAPGTCWCAWRSRPRCCWASVPPSQTPWAPPLSLWSRSPWPMPWSTLRPCGPSSRLPKHTPSPPRRAWPCPTPRRRWRAASSRSSAIRTCCRSSGNSVAQASSWPQARPIYTTRRSARICTAMWWARTRRVPSASAC